MTVLTKSAIAAAMLAIMASAAQAQSAGAQQSGESRQIQVLPAPEQQQVAQSAQADKQPATAMTAQRLNRKTPGLKERCRRTPRKQTRKQSRRLSHPPRRDLSRRNARPTPRDTDIRVMDMPVTAIPSATAIIAPEFQHQTLLEES